MLRSTFISSKKDKEILKIEDLRDSRIIKVKYMFIVDQTTVNSINTKHFTGTLFFSV